MGVFYKSSYNKGKMLMKFKILVDSTADISNEILEKYDITVAYLDVIMDGQPYNSKDVTNQEFYNHLSDCIKKKKTLPKTSAVNSYTFEQILKDYCNLDDTFVLAFTIAKEMSNTQQALKQAINDLNMENIYVVDTVVTTFALGALAIEAAKLALNQNLSKDEMIEAVNDLNDRVWTYVSIADLGCLRAGGRLSSKSMLLGSMLRLKPIVQINKKVEVCAKSIGQGKANKWIVDHVKESMDSKYPLYFGHSNGLEILEKYKTNYGKSLNLSGDELVFEMGPVVVAHAGLGCAGIAFFKKK